MMGQTNFLEEIDCGSFFDHIDDLIDFPVDDVVDIGAGSGAASAAHKGDFTFPGDLWPSQCDSLPAPASDLSAELSVPYEDIVQLEWLSNFVEDSFSGGSLQEVGGENVSVAVNNVVMRQHFQTSSPVSVLESSSSCSGEKTSPRSPELTASARCGRARSKRPRPATFIPRPAMQLISSNSMASDNPQSMIITPKITDAESYAESRLVIKFPKHSGAEQKKKKKIKVTPPMSLGNGELSCLTPQAVRKCMHCEITKTPQWRAGPMGPKTLCNACGVRFKSGRLFPEYRPAASPTFIPSLHSNSHKKVLEMRNKGGEKVVLVGGVAVVAKSSELIPNKTNIPMDYQ